MARDAAKEDFWRGKLAEYEKSGLTVRGFCTREQVREVQFYYWRRALKADGEGKTGFVELVHPGGANGASGVSIRVDERIRIELERGFDTETLQAALAVTTSAGV